MWPFVSITAKVTSPARLRATASAPATRRAQHADSAFAAAGTRTSEQQGGDERAHGGILRAFTLTEPQRVTLRTPLILAPDRARVLQHTRGVRVEASSSVIPLDATQAAEIVDRIVTNVKRVIHAPDETLRLCVLALLAEGHVILEDAPGVGKTPLAKALAKSVDLRFSRAQFTPDLLPSDVTGVSVYDQRDERVRVPSRPGVHRHPAGRRDQPRLAEDPVRPARVHAGEPGHGRRRDVPRSRPVHGARDARTRSSTRAPTRCPRRSSTGS